MPLTIGHGSDTSRALFQATPTTMTTATLAPPSVRSPDTEAGDDAARHTPAQPPAEYRLTPGVTNPPAARMPAQPRVLVHWRSSRWLQGLLAQAARLGQALSSLGFLVVVLPTLLSALYFGVIASDLFVSESTFVVRSSERPAAGGLMGALLPGAAFSGPQDDARVVHSYMRSRDALAELDARLQLRAKYSDKTVDRLSRFPRLDFDNSAEGFFRYWRDHVSAEPDASSSLSVLRVSAFDGATAQQVNIELLNMAEALVNRLNERIRTDALRLATTELARAERQADDVARELAGFRSRNDVYDPDRQSALQLAANGKLQEDLVLARGQLMELRAISPDNPRVALMHERVGQLEREIAQGNVRVTGAQKSLTQQVAGMQQLQVRQASADRQLAAALAALEQARNDARRQQLYLERIASPSLPDVAQFPRPLRAVLTTLVLALVACGLLLLMRTAVREHRD